jgi:phage FluMu gp28-like protein
MSAAAEIAAAPERDWKGFSIHVPTSARERKEWEAKIRRTRLLGYQQRWIADKSRIKGAEKCRQAGFSWTDALDTLLETSGAEWPFDCWVSSRDQIQAQLYGQDVGAWAKKLDVVAGELGESVLEDADGRKVSALRVPLANGRSIWSLSSNVDAQAGKRGTRKMDEFALNPENRRLYAIGKPGTQWGGRLVFFSTHRGTANFFNELIVEVREKGNPKKISLHRVTIVDAVNDGLLVKLKQQWAKLDPHDARLVMSEDEWLQSQRDECPDEETWNQEYLCNPADDSTAFLTYDLLATCVLRGPDNLRVTTEETRDLSGRKGKIRRLQSLTLEEMAALPFDLYGGIDIGRKRDFTLAWFAAQIGDVLTPIALVEMENVAFSRQEQEVYPLLGLPRMRRTCIDRTGIGAQFAERARENFGLYRVEEVNFTPAVKEELAYPILTAFQDRTTRIPDDRVLIAAHRAIKKQQTLSDNVRFAADHGPNGHADHFWAHALCKHAAKTPAVELWSALT